MIFGRELELQSLNSAYEQMLAGRGSVLFLTGEAGLGKTTLVHEWRAEGRGLGDEDSGMRDEGRGMRDEEKSLVPQPSTLFLESACSIPIGNVDVGRLEALQPWADVIAQAQEKIDQTDRTDRTDHSKKKKLDFKKLIHEAAPAWAWAIPFVGDIAHAALETSRLVKEQRGDFEVPHAAQNQQQVFQQYVNLLTKVAEETPLVIFLDDLHWADTSSCNLLFYLSRQIADKRILVIGTYRQDDAAQANDGKGHAIVTIKNEILRYKTGDEITLSYLNRNAIRSYLSYVFPSYEVNDNFERWLERISDGNSLFMTQFVLTLREDKHLNEHGAFVGAYDSITIPKSALAVVEERTRRLNAGTRELLMYATAEGEEFTTYVLERLADKKPLELLKELRAAMGMGLITERGTGRLYANMTTGIFGFSHALFHKALYDSLLETQKAHLHQQCFVILKTEWDRLSDARQRTTTLATKLLTHAEKSEEWMAVAEVALEAAKEFWKTYNEEESLGMIARVRAASDHEPSAAPQNAEAHFLEGRIGGLRGRYEEAIASYRTAAAGFRGMGMAERAIDALNGIAYCQHRASDYDTSTATASCALEESLALGYAKGQASSLDIVGSVRNSQGLYAEALEHYAKSLAIRESIQDRADVAGSLNNIGNVHNSQGLYAEALEYYAKSLAIRESIQDRAGVAVSLNNIGNVHYSQGRYAEALEYYAKSLAIQESIQDRARAAMSMNNIGNVHASQGRYAEALEYYTKSLAIREAIQDRAGVAMSLSNIGGVHYSEGRHGEALEYHAKSLVIQESIHDRVGVAGSLLNIGNVHNSQGRDAEALEYHARSLAIRESIQDRAGVAVSLLNIAVSYRKLASYAVSADYLTRALALSREINYRGVEGESLCEFGLLVEAQAVALAGDARMARLHEAVGLLEKGIAIFAELNRPQNVEEHTLDLVRIRELLEQG